METESKVMLPEAGIKYYSAHVFQNITWYPTDKYIFILLCISQK